MEEEAEKLKQMQTEVNNEMTSPVGSALMKEKTKPLPELKYLPVEVLAKIFNFLPNHDIRCGVSLVCKKFYEICQDESLVPVKDLCIYGDKKNEWKLENIGAVSDIIVKSKNLTSLKIKGLDLKTANELVSIALQACAKLIHLEIVETPEMPKNQDVSILNIKFRRI